jgi:hypothetical protein
MSVTWQCHIRLGCKGSAPQWLMLSGLCLLLTSSSVLAEHEMTRAHPYARSASISPFAFQARALARNCTSLRTHYQIRNILASSQALSCKCRGLCALRSPTHDTLTTQLSVSAMLNF